jgi:hypothetical protein
VVATVQGNVAGTWVRGVTVNVPGQSFAIRLNKAAPKGLQRGRLHNRDDGLSDRVVLIARSRTCASGR